MRPVGRREQRSAASGSATTGCPAVRSVCSEARRSCWEIDGVVPPHVPSYIFLVNPVFKYYFYTRIYRDACARLMTSHTTERTRTLGMDADHTPYYRRRSPKAVHEPLHRLYAPIRIPIRYAHGSGLL